MRLATPSPWKTVQAPSLHVVVHAHLANRWDPLQRLGYY